MPRFSKNRWWTFILALCLCFAGSFALLTAAHAGTDPYVDGTPPPNGTGDPDVPDGTGKTSGHQLPRGAATPVGTSYELRSVGDGTTATNVVMWRLRLVWLGLKSFYIRY